MPESAGHECWMIWASWAQEVEAKVMAQEREKAQKAAKMKGRRR